jgi:hypothetical protein
VAYSCPHRGCTHFTESVDDAKRHRAEPHPVGERAARLVRWMAIGVALFVVVTGLIVVYYFSIHDGGYEET